MVVFANGIQGLRDIDTSKDKYIDVRVTNVRRRCPKPNDPALLRRRFIEI
jgi:hypothetical protein